MGILRNEAIRSYTIVTPFKDVNGVHYGIKCYDLGYLLARTRGEGSSPFECTIFLREILFSKIHTFIALAAVCIFLAKLVSERLAKCVSQRR